MRHCGACTADLFRTGLLVIISSLCLLVSCGEEPEVIRSVVLKGGAYVQIDNPGVPLDTTSLAALNNGVFSLELRAAGDTLPQGITESPTLFMVSNDESGDEIWVARIVGDSSRIYVFIGDAYAGSYSIPGCDWNDPDIFTHVVITYDGSTASIYGNGEHLGSETLGVDLNIGSSHALIGALWNVANDPSFLGNFWYGAIDEVRLWTKVLPAGEMAFRYENPDKLTKNYSPTGLDSLLGLWRFNERDGDTVFDGSGKGNHGILIKGNGQFDFTDAGA